MFKVKRTRVFSIFPWPKNTYAKVAPFYSCKTVKFTTVKNELLHRTPNDKNQTLSYVLMYTYII
jgi:hypothetical protein